MSGTDITIITAIISVMGSIIVALINSHNITLPQLKLNWKLTFSWLIFFLCCVYWFIGGLTALMFFTVPNFSVMTLAINLGTTFVSTVAYYFTRHMGDSNT